jgi:hypothetical protein
MSAVGPNRSSKVVLADVIRELRTEGFGARVVADPDELVVVYASDPRLDPWDDPTEDRLIEMVRIEHRDGHLHCPWLPGPIPDIEFEGLGTMLRTLMETRGY